MLLENFNVKGINISYKILYITFERITKTFSGVLRIFNELLTKVFTVYPQRVVRLLNNFCLSTEIIYVIVFGDLFS